jgi:murein DD-endopeptidase MepM/ murein hydrolase activator NlpD
VIAFYSGVAAGWWLHSGVEHGRAQQPDDMVDSPAPGPVAPSDPARIAPRDHARIAPEDARPAPTRGLEPALVPVPPLDPVAELRRRRLLLPVEGAEVGTMEGDFVERRGERRHEAVDILAPRHTPIRAVEAGTIAKLFFSKAGGTTIYQFDPSKRFCYYYAHLERYASSLHEGQVVAAGDVIGYVGTTGNAPSNTPHLHFAVFELTKDRRWWEGRPLDPYLIFQR